MSSQSLQAYYSLLAESRIAFESTGVSAVTTEDTFRDAYLKLCDQYRERDAERLLSKLQDQYDDFTTFAEGIENAGELHVEAISGVYWISLLSIVARAFHNGVRLERLLSLLTSYELPSLQDIDITNHFNHSNVRASLLAIFKVVIDSHLSIVECLGAPASRITSASPGGDETIKGVLREQDLEQIKAILYKIDAKIEEHKQEWNDNVVIAQEEEEEERRRSASFSTASFPSGLNGDVIYPAGTNVTFEYLRHLGRGKNGEVAALREPTTGEVYACKLIRCTNALYATEMEEEVKNEVNAMRNLRHHHIASIGFWNKDPAQFTFRIFLLPAGDAHLGDYLSSSGGRARFGKDHDLWFGCLISALHHAHVRGIIHRDIKPSNIIIKDDQPYLTDFGAAKDFSAFESSVSEEDTIRGTPNYLAPEDSSGVQHGRSSDIFSLGCVFAEMLTVRQGRTLEEFREWRRSPHQMYPHAFRDNLGKVDEWLLGLKCSETPGFIRKQARKMLQIESRSRPEIK